jgi:hypothetical protein
MAGRTTWKGFVSSSVFFPIPRATSCSPCSALLLGQQAGSSGQGVRHQEPPMTSQMRKPTWVLGLSNQVLGDKFEAAVAVWGAGQGQPDNLGRRLDVLAEEISRREREGLWTDEDWLDEAHTHH